MYKNNDNKKKYPELATKQDILNLTALVNSYNRRAEELLKELRKTNTMDNYLKYKVKN